MNFTKVPKQIQPYILKLTDDDIFLQRYDTDEVLNQLDKLKYNPFIQYNQFLLTLHQETQFFGVHFKPITLAMWSYLYIIKSPIIFEDKQITTVDIDMFFYLIETKDFSSLNTVLQKSLNFCSNYYSLTDKQLQYVFQNLLKISFRVLNMFPKLRIEGNKPVFNVDWLTSIATKVAQVSNYNIQQVYNGISVCQAYYLFAQYCREKGSESIYLRTEDEIMQEEDLRSCVLIVERLIELKAIEQKDKDFYINLMHSEQEQKQEKKDGC